MMEIIKLPTFTDDRGSLTVVEKLLPFDIKRVYFIYDVHAERGGHRHRKTTQAMVCLHGSCDLYINNGSTEATISLNNPSQCVILEPEDWHSMGNFTANTVLTVFASAHYDKNDYIYEPYP